MMKMSERRNSENRYESNFENVLYESPMEIEEELEEEEADLPPCRDLIHSYNLISRRVLSVTVLLIIGNITYLTGESCLLLVV
jgi:hypothetical protein